MGEVEVALPGGMDNRGNVVRVGDTVRRPIRREGPAAAVRALLVHLERVGFDGAPRYRGIDDRGRDVVSFIDGEVPLPPYPAWSMSDEALVSVARLLRRFHDATGSFDLGSTDAWFPSWADPVGGDVVCHNDPCPENIVFRAGEAVALIDFDLAAPGRRLWELAVASQTWCPLSAPESRDRYPRHLDAIARLRRFARGYGVTGENASLLVETAFLARQQALAHIRDQIAAGVTVWVSEWQRTDGEGRAAADDAWLEQHRAELVDALRD